MTNTKLSGQTLHLSRARVSTRVYSSPAVSYGLYPVTGEKTCLGEIILPTCSTAASIGETFSLKRIVELASLHNYKVSFRAASRATYFELTLGRIVGRLRISNCT
jgi:hypothetical protein